MDKDASPIALEFAGFRLRLAAFIIDAVIVGVAISIVLGPFKWLGWPQLWNGNWYWMVLPVIIASNLLGFLMNAVYDVGFWAWRGQTPGKMLLNIKVIRTDGSDVTLTYSIFRFLGYIISGALLGIGFLWIAIDPRKQGLHDKIADTVVVKIPEMRRPETMLASPRAG